MCNLQSLFCLCLLFLGVTGLLNAQNKNYKNVIDYGNFQYEYTLNEFKPNQFKVQIGLLAEGGITNEPPPIVYDSQLKIEGKIEKGKQFKIITYYAANQPDKTWKIDYTSFVEILFDFQLKLMEYKEQSIISRFREEQVTEVLDTDLTPQELSEQKAIDLAMTFLILNYNQLLGQGAISNKPKKATVFQMNKRNMVFVSSDKSGHTIKDTLSFMKRTYEYELSETEEGYYSLDVKTVSHTANKEHVSAKVVFSSNIRVDDQIEKNGNYKIKLYYAANNGSSWKVNPMSYVLTDFDFKHKKVKYHIEGSKLNETKHPKMQTEHPFGNKHTYTTNDMLNDAIRHFIRYFNKALSH